MLNKKINYFIEINITIEQFHEFHAKKLEKISLEILTSNFYFSFALLSLLLLFFITNFVIYILFLKKKYYENQDIMRNKKQK